MQEQLFAPKPKERPFPLRINGVRGVLCEGGWRLADGQVEPLPAWAVPRIERARRLGLGAWEGTSPRR